ncbi:MAG: flagellar M-ring protein FliF [Candidatus Puniceispirillum sp.]|nr:flagellar M-ring protein FliF [Candidatus Pelagibacter sp.]MBA4282871.1 flagellar M-ring protein FliF [Candidatus Puniceispirillum sp.]
MEALRNQFLKLGLTRSLSIIGVTLVTLIFFAYLALRTTVPDLGLLFANLDPSDASKISERLKVMNIPHEIKGESSDQIFAQKDQISKLRMELAADGLPAGGTIGYELFDKSDFMGTSSAMIDINMLRATEGEIAKSIRTIQGVMSARIHLVLPKKELFSQEKSLPSASVIIKMKGTSRLSVNQVLAIQHLVASAIPELTLDRISIIDDKGTLLAKGTDTTLQQMSSLTQMELKGSYESKVARSIESLLENTVGPGKIRAEVNVDMDFDQISTQSVEYDPDGQVARSSQSSNEGSNSNESALSDTTSIQNNQPGNNSGPSNQSKNQDTRNEENISYEISNTTKTHVKETGAVKRISIAILVDGVYEIDKEGKSTYKPRSAEDIIELTELAKTASGFNEKRGDVIKITNMKFNEVPTEPESSSAINKILTHLMTSKYIENLVILFMGLLLYFKVIKPYALQVAGASGFVVQKKSTVSPPPSISPPEIEKEKKEVVEIEEESDELINVEHIDGLMKSSSIKKVGEIIHRHPEETISIIRSWMQQ